MTLSLSHNLQRRPGIHYKLLQCGHHILIKHNFPTGIHHLCMSTLRVIHIIFIFKYYFIINLFYYFIMHYHTLPFEFLNVRTRTSNQMIKSSHSELSHHSCISVAFVTAWEHWMLRLDHLFRCSRPTIQSLSGNSLFSCFPVSMHVCVPLFYYTFSIFFPPYILGIYFLNSFCLFIIYIYAWYYSST